MDAATSQGPSVATRSWKRQDGVFSRSFKGVRPCLHLDFDFCLQNSEGINSWCFQHPLHPSLWEFCPQNTHEGVPSAGHQHGPVELSPLGESKESGGHAPQSCPAPGPGDWGVCGPLPLLSEGGSQEALVLCLKEGLQRRNAGTGAGGGPGCTGSSGSMEGALPSSLSGPRRPLWPSRLRSILCHSWAGHRVPPHAGLFSESGT